MYRIYANDEILHNPMLAESGRITVQPVLREKLNTHGTLEFAVAPTNPLYDVLEERTTAIKVLSDTNANNKPWFGRVMHIEDGWKKVKKVYCEGELAYLCDSTVRPFGFKGSPSDLLSEMLTIYRGSRTNGPRFRLGNVSVTDPNNTIVRSSSKPATVWETISEKLFKSSLGGFILPRFEGGIHYVDYLSLDENDQFARTSSQVVKYGKNLLDFSLFSTAEDIITVLLPYGAQIEQGQSGYEAGPPEPTSGLQTWTGNRVTISAANNGQDWIEDTAASRRWGRIVGTHCWDDVTLAANLLTKANAYLQQQIWKSVTLEMSAVDLAFVDADIDQIQVGEYVRVQSVPHDMNVLMLCTEKETYLTELEQSAIILGAGRKTISDLEGGTINVATT